MNETFVRAKTIFDRMMEEGIARHTASMSSVLFILAWIFNLIFFMSSV